MPFEKGQSGNPKGRPKGKPNKSTEGLRVQISQLLEENFDQIRDDLESIAPEKRIKFFIDLLQYSLPKLHTQRMQLNFDEMTDEQIDGLLNRMIND